MAYWRATAEKAPGAEDDLRFPSPPADLTRASSSRSAVGDIFRTNEHGLNGRPCPH